MDEIRDQFIDVCVTELCKDKNKEQIINKIVDPITLHIFEKIQYVLIIIAIFMILLYMKITFLLYISLKKISA